MPMPHGERAVQAVMIMEMKREPKEEVRLRVLFFLAGLFLMHPSGCGAMVFLGSIEANFTASPMNSVDVRWIFLASRNGTFNLRWYNPTGKHSFYLCVMHAQSDTVVWSANRGSPISNTDKFVLTREGAVIQTSSGRILWSVKGSDVGSIQLRDDGNLLMLDNLSQAQVWQSFDHPTDTLLLGQRLVLGSKLVSNTAEDNYSLGDYEVSLIQSDLALKWDVPGFDLQTYWSMAGDSRTVNLLSNSAFNVAYAAVGQSGLNLYSSSSSSFSMALQLPAAVAYKTILRRAVIDPSGQFRILSFISGRWLYDLEAVEKKCRLPATCGPLGICLGLSNSLGFQCSCPKGFQMINQTDASQGCEAPDTPNCNSSYKDLLLKKAIAFVSVGDGVDYFAHEFQIPIKTSTMQDCEQMCLKNCSCAAFFFLNTSGSCFLHGFVGSMISSRQILDQAYLKVIRSVKQKESENRIVPIVIGLAGAATLVLLVCLGLVLFCYRKKISNLSSKTAANDPDDGDEVLRSIPGLPTRYSYADIRTATDNFAHKIGSGGFGVVYEGTLPDQTKVAVKKLDTLLGQGKKEFYSEIAIIGSIHHVNLVKLHGFCVEGSNRLLVYEHMSRGSLDRSLFGYPVLEWQERCDIALGTARGLAYLHEGCRQKIIHCDIKPENILLNEKLETKVSDFGLAKLLSREESQAFTTMRGTRGYLAPEWLTNASISDRTDVYSYGMLLLEIIGGRKNSFPSETDSHDHDTFDYFPTRALQLCEDRRFSEAADPRLEGRFNLEEVEKLVKIALCCLHEDSNQRPSMSKVVHMIEGNLRVEDPQVDSLMFLRIYARRINSTGTLNLNLNLPPTNNSSDRSTVFSYSPSPSHANRSMISSAQLSGPR